MTFKYDLVIRLHVIKLSKNIESLINSYYLCTVKRNNPIMTYNLIAYLIYLSITFFITVRVGWICYQNGVVYIYQILNDEEMTQLLNKFLLIGYYLMNLGYMAVSIYFWEEIGSFLEMINIVSQRIGLIVLMLAGMHYFNITFIALFGKRIFQN